MKESERELLREFRTKFMDSFDFQSKYNIFEINAKWDRILIAMIREKGKENE